MTEFWSPFAWSIHRRIAVQLAADLCRHAPTWIATLDDRPSPIHLAEAIVLDHPDKYEIRDVEGQTAESGE